jgi:hypothetical protein
VNLILREPHERTRFQPRPQCRRWGDYDYVIAAFAGRGDGPATNAAAAGDCADLFRNAADMVPLSEALRLSNMAVEAMAEAYGFAYGQAASAQAVGLLYPELRERAEVAQRHFELRFRPAVELIDSVLLSLGAEWKQHRSELRGQIEARTRSRPFTVGEAESLPRTIEARTIGKADVRYVQTLLIYHPELLAAPAEEVLGGYRQLFATDGSGKSKGVRLRLHIPLTWSGRDGERPNIVQFFTSEAGRGLESFAVQVRSLDLPSGTTITRQDVEDFAYDPLLGRYPTAGTSLVELCSERTALDGLPGRTIYTRGVMASPVGPLEQIGVSYVTVVGNQILILQGSVADADGAGDRLTARFRRFEPLFQLIANSVVIENRWE